MQKAERDIEELRQSIRQMFSNLLSLRLEAHDRAAISKQRPGEAQSAKIKVFS